MSASGAEQVAEGDRPGAVAVRVSDAERERVASRLAEAHGEGRLTLAEFDERVRAAHGAVVRADLEPLLADLPDPAAVGGAESPGRGRHDRPSGPIPFGRVPSTSGGRHDRPVPFGPAPFGSAPFGSRPFPMPFPMVGPCAGHGLRGAVAIWAVVSAVNLVIWVAVVAGTGHLVHPWWIWVAGPWGLVLLARLGSRRDPSGARS